MILLFVLLHSFVLQAAPSADVIDGAPIPKAEIDEYLSLHQGTDRAQATERLVLYHLAVQEAKRRGWDRDLETTRAIDKALYASYLRHTRDASATQLEPSTDDLQEAYRKSSPACTRVLTLRGNKTAHLRQIRAQWVNGSPFENWS